MITYAAVVWWPRADQKGPGRQLERIQRLRTTPMSALEIIIGVMRITTYIKQEAMLACYHMQLNCQWIQTCAGHTGS